MSFQAPDEWLAAQALEHAYALPAPFYGDRAAADDERVRVFARSWQLVAHLAQLSHPGDHVVAEIAAVPVLIVRGDDDVLRGFHNVCRHRAGPIASCNGRAARSLVCRYHGWTYALDGSLRGAPEMKDVEDFDVSTIRLPEIRVAAWQGLVFAALGDVPELGTVLEGIDARLGDSQLHGYQFERRVSYEIRCNWKVYVDNFLEGYHLPIVHPALNRLFDYRSYLTEVAEWHSLQWSPLETAGDTNFYGSGDALYYFVYPNTMLNILPGRLQTNRVVPLDVNRCRVDFDYYYPADDSADGEARRACDLEFSDEVQQEDIDICEAVQRGIDSGSYHAGRLNPKRESGVHHFHELYRRAWRRTS